MKRSLLGEWSSSRERSRSHTHGGGSPLAGWPVAGREGLQSGTVGPRLGMWVSRPRGGGGAPGGAGGWGAPGGGGGGLVGHGRRAWAEPDHVTPTLNIFSLTKSP